MDSVATVTGAIGFAVDDSNTQLNLTGSFAAFLKVQTVGVLQHLPAAKLMVEVERVRAARHIVVKIEFIA